MLHTCRLNAEEYKFFKKNPHCLSSVCDLSRIDKPLKKSSPYYKYSSSDNNISDTNLKPININEVKREKGIYEEVDDLFTDAFLDMGGEIKYTETGQRPKSSIHLGQLKLFLSTMQFLTKYTEKDKLTHVIYPGSAPGDNINLLSELFPDCLWYLYDPRDIFYPELYQNEKIRKIVVDYFTDPLIDELLGELGNDANMLLISDIRVCAEENEDTVDRDMKLQADWVRKIRPDYASLKFRIPRIFGDKYSYLDGELYLQMFARVSSTECRLVVNKRNLEDVEYDLSIYEGLMYYFNRRARVLCYSKNTGIDGFDGCHDCSAAIYVINEYVRKFWHKISENDIVAASEILFNNILKKIVGKKLFYMNKEISKNILTKR